MSVDEFYELIVVKIFLSNKKNGKGRYCEKTA